MSGYLKEQTLGGRLDELAVQYGGKPALITEQKSLSFDGLRASAERAAAFFIDAGLKRGDIAALQLPPSLLFAEVLFGLFKIGVMPVLLLPTHRESDVKSICERAQPSFYITATGCAIDHAQVIYANTIASALKAKPEAHDYPRPSFSDNALLLLSGGSTGVPKLVPRTHAAYLYAAEVSAKCFHLSSDDIYLCTFPVAHHGGLGCGGLVGGLQAGATAIVTDSNEPAEIFRLIDKYKVTALQTPPATVTRLLQAYNGSDMSSLKSVITGTAPLKPETARRVMELFSVKFYNAYGSSEGICFVADPYTDPLDVVCEGHGRPMSDGDEFFIADTNGNPVPDGVAGELWGRGPYTAAGYYNAPEATREAFTTDGYFRTGDLAVTHAGYTHICGRMKDQINRGGEKVSPEEIENLLLQHENIKECCVVGVEDSELGQRVCAFIVPRSGVPDRNELRQFLKNKQIAYFKIPDQIEFLHKLPRSGVGKVDKRGLAQMAGELRSAFLEKRSEEPIGDSVSMLKTLWLENLHLSNFSDSDDYFELGGDSLRAKVLLESLEEATGLKVPPELLYTNSEFRMFETAIQNLKGVL
jgi:non-ribosomal peptide synthetase component E (peptide arylation enzyme)/acyl carrier protein